MKIEFRVLLLCLYNEVKFRNSDVVVLCVITHREPTCLHAVHPHISFVVHLEVIHFLDV